MGSRAAQLHITGNFTLIDKCSAEHLSMNVKLPVMWSWVAKGPVTRRLNGFQLHIYLNLQGLQPVKDRAIFTPWRSRFAGDGLDLSDGLALHFQIDFCIAICCRRTGMAEQVTDCRQVNTRLQKRYGRAVPDAVGMQPFLAQIRSVAACNAKTPCEDMANSETGQRLASVIKKHVTVRPRIEVPLITERFQHCGGLRPYRTVAFFSSLAEQSHLKRLSELEIASA
jgi:hypothetical protein